MFGWKKFAELSAENGVVVVVGVAAAAAAAAATDCCCKCAPSIRIIAYDDGDVLVSAAPAIKTEAAKKYMYFCVFGHLRALNYIISLQ